MSALETIRNLLSDACGGAVTDESDSSAWDATRYAEHVRERTVALVELLFTIDPDAEHLGQPYGDAFDAIEAALHKSHRRAAILDRLVLAGYVTESLIDDIDARLSSESDAGGDA